MNCSTQLEESAVASGLAGMLESNTAVVGVVGLGYVGLPLAHALHQGGLSIIGIDVDEEKVACIDRNENYLKHLGDEMVNTLSKSDRFSATTSFDQLADCDVIIVCVPTPLGRHQEPDLSYIIETAAHIGRSARPGQLVILESTTYPSTTRDVMLPAILEHCGEFKDELVVGENYFIAFSPEREDPGRKDHSTSTIPKLVGGLDNRSTLLASNVYRKGVSNVVEVSSAEVAESAKLLENIFRAVNIALVNEMKVVLGKMDIDIWEVVEAASTKPFGFMPFFPGPGLGGHCIPIDPFYLTWKAKEVGCSTKFIELAGEINTAMPEYVVQQIASALNDHGKSVNGAKILVMGLAYKPDVDDTRESPSFEIIHQLRNRGADVSYSDPHIPNPPKMSRPDSDLVHVDLNPGVIADFDAVVISTNHAAFNYAMVANEAKLVIDTRNAMSSYRDALGDRLVMA